MLVVWPDRPMASNMPAHISKRQGIGQEGEPVIPPISDFPLTGLFIPAVLRWGQEQSAKVKALSLNISAGTSNYPGFLMCDSTVSCERLGSHLG